MYHPFFHVQSLYWFVALSILILCVRVCVGNVYAVIMLYRVISVIIIIAIIVSHFAVKTQDIIIERLRINKGSFDFLEKGFKFTPDT